MEMLTAHARLKARIRAAAGRAGMSAERLEAVQDLLRDRIRPLGRGLPESDRQAFVSTLFCRRSDADATGELDARELARTVRNELGIGPQLISNAEIVGLVDALDADGSSSASAAALLRFVQVTPSAVREATQRLDSAARALGMPDIGAVFAHFGDAAAGPLSYEELLHALREGARVDGSLLPDADVLTLVRLCDETEGGSERGSVRIEQLVGALAAEVRAIEEAEALRAKSARLAAAGGGSGGERLEGLGDYLADERILEGDEEEPSEAGASPAVLPGSMSYDTGLAQQALPAGAPLTPTRQQSRPRRSSTESQSTVSSLPKSAPRQRPSTSEAEQASGRRRRGPIGSSASRMATAPAGASRAAALGGARRANRAPSATEPLPAPSGEPRPPLRPVPMYAPGVSKVALLETHAATAMDAYIREQLGGPLDSSLSQLLLEISECVLGGLHASDWLAEPERFVAHALRREKPLERLVELESGHLLRADRRAARAAAQPAASGKKRAPEPVAVEPPRASECVLAGGVFDGRALLPTTAERHTQDVVAALRAAGAEVVTAFALPSLGPTVMHETLGLLPALARLSFAPGAEGGDITAGLGELLGRSSSVVALDALGARFSLQHGTQLASAIGNSRSLVALALPAARFEMGSAQEGPAADGRQAAFEASLCAAGVLREMLASCGACETLRIVSLPCAHLGDAGALALARALRRAPAVERVDVCGCSIGDEGLEAIATLVGGFRVGAELDYAAHGRLARALAGSGSAATGRASGRASAALPADHPGLTSLDISCNRHSLAGALALVSAVARDRDRARPERAEASWLDAFRGGEPAEAAEAEASAQPGERFGADPADPQPQPEAPPLMPTSPARAARARHGPRLAVLVWRASAACAVHPRDRALLAAALGRAVASHGCLRLLDVSGLIALDVSDTSDAAGASGDLAGAAAAAGAPAGAADGAEAALGERAAGAAEGSAPAAASAVAAEGEGRAEGAPALGRARPPLPWRVPPSTGAAGSAAARRACLAHAAGQLGRCLAPCAGLRALSVRGCGLADGALAALLHGLASAPAVEVRLELLDCARNGGARLAGCAAARLLRAAHGLRALDLSANALSAIDVVPLLRALGGHRSLRRLDLSANRLGDYELVRMGDVLPPAPAPPPPPPADAKKEALKAHADASAAANAARAARAEVESRVVMPRQGLRELGAALRRNWRLADLRLAANGLGEVAEPARLPGDELLLRILAGEAPALPPAALSEAADAQADAALVAADAEAAAAQPPLSAAASAARVPLARARAAADALRALLPSHWAELTAPADVLPADVLRAVCAALELAGAPEHLLRAADWRALRRELRLPPPASRLAWGAPLASALSTAACAPHEADEARCARAAVLLPDDAAAFALRRYRAKALDALSEAVRATLAARPLALALAPAELPRPFDPTGTAVAGKGKPGAKGGSGSGAEAKPAKPAPAAKAGKPGAAGAATPRAGSEARAGCALADSVVSSSSFGEAGSTALPRRAPAAASEPVSPAAPAQLEGAARAKPPLEALVLARGLRSASTLPLRSLDLSANPRLLGGGPRPLRAVRAALETLGSVAALRLGGSGAPGAEQLLPGGPIASDRPACALAELMAAEASGDRAATSLARAADAKARWALWRQRRQASASQADLLALLPVAVRERARALLVQLRTLEGAAPEGAGQAGGQRGAPVEGAPSDESSLDCARILRALGAADALGAHANARRPLPACGFVGWLLDLGGAELDTVWDAELRGGAAAGGAGAAGPARGACAAAGDAGARAARAAEAEAEATAEAALGAASAELAARAACEAADEHFAPPGSDEHFAPPRSGRRSSAASPTLALLHLLASPVQLELRAGQPAPDPTPLARWARSCALALVRTDCYFQPLRGPPLRLAPSHFGRAGARSARWPAALPARARGAAARLLTRVRAPSLPHLAPFPQAVPRLRWAPWRGCARPSSRRAVPPRPPAASPPRQPTRRPPTASTSCCTRTRCPPPRWCAAPRRSWTRSGSRLRQ